MIALFVKIRKIVYIISVSALFLSLVLTITLIIFDDNMRTIINNYSDSIAKVKVNKLLNDKVYYFLENNKYDYSDITSITYDNDNNVKSIKIDSSTVNKIKSGIISTIQNEIIDNSELNIGIPIGTILGNSFTINRGPELPINLIMSSAVESKVDSTFEGSGINQTLHRIVLDVKVDIYMVMPWYRTNTTLETDFIIAETVIVGKVPDAFTVVIESEEDNTGGLINDYGANNYN